jgi:hypothetical protein
MNAAEILRRLIRLAPGTYHEGQLRSMERRVREWAFRIVLALGPQQVALQRLRCFDQRQQACGARTEGTIGEQAAHQAVLPQLLACGTGGKQLPAKHSQQRLLEGIELTRPQPTAIRQALGRSGWDGNGAIRGVLHAPAQAGARQPHGGAGTAPAVHRDVEGGATAANGNRAQSAAGEVETQGAQTGGAAETEAHGNQRVGPEGRPEQGSGCPADAAVCKSMHPVHETVGSATSRGGGKRLRSIALTASLEVREQDLQRASTSAQKAYFEVEGRPGSQPDPHPPKESGQGSPEPVRTAEVRQRCDTQQVNSVTWRVRHPVAAESHMPLLIPAC